MRWGFAWELGPFESWDAIGVERMATALEREGKGLPPLVRKVLGTPGKTFYESEKGTHAVFRFGRDCAEAGGRARRDHYFEIAERAHPAWCRRIQGLA